MDPIDEIIRMIEEGISRFTKWDWTQDFYCKICDKTYNIDGEDDVKLHDLCEHIKSEVDMFARDVRDSAWIAATHANQAIEAIKDKDFDLALDELWWACHLESEYGDCPSYKPAYEALQNYYDEFIETSES